jgi:hypothetical protein
MKKIIIFDLDGTLAPSKWKIDEEMRGLFKKLLDKYKVAIISWWDFVQFDKQILPYLDSDSNFDNLTIFPTCGAKFYSFKDFSWNKIYSNDFNVNEKELILKTLNKAVLKFWFDKIKIYWPQIEDRWSQITFSALWQQAPLEIKENWDPDFKKRIEVIDYMWDDLTDFKVSFWWKSSIDITKKWIDKSYWIAKITEFFWFDKSEMFFVWDALFPGGNDYPVKEAWVESILTTWVEQTKEIIKQLLNNL